MGNISKKPKPKPAKRVKRTARIVFANGSEFHTTTNEFWSYVKRGFVRLVSEKPLVAEVTNETEFRLIFVGHTVFRADGREHLTEVMNAKKHYKRKKGFS
jgi:hypothetical protein